MAGTVTPGPDHPDPQQHDEHDEHDAGDDDDVHVGQHVQVDELAPRERQLLVHGVRLALGGHPVGAPGQVLHDQLAAGVCREIELSPVRIGDPHGRGDGMTEKSVPYPEVHRPQQDHDLQDRFALRRAEPLLADVDDVRPVDHHALHRVGRLLGDRGAVPDPGPHGDEVQRARAGDGVGAVGVAAQGDRTDPGGVDGPLALVDEGEVEGSLLLEGDLQPHPMVDADAVQRLGVSLIRVAVAVPADELRRAARAGRRRVGQLDAVPARRSGDERPGDTAVVGGQRLPVEGEPGGRCRGDRHISSGFGDGAAAAGVANATAESSVASSTPIRRSPLYSSLTPLHRAPRRTTAG